MIQWQDKTRFRVGETAFRCYDWMFGSQPSTPDEYFLQKDADMVRDYARLAAEISPQQIFELGIWQGGSCVFFNELCRPKKLVAVELNEERIVALDTYRATSAQGRTLTPLYGIDQADSATLAEILQTEFGDTPLDLVIDDASHFVDETRTSFNLLFPRLRPGGAYVIEDWAWAHDPVDDPAGAVNLYPGKEPLTRLVFELVLAAGSTHDLIRHIEVDSHKVTVYRGERAIDSGSFNVSDLCLPRGQALLATSVDTRS